MNVHTAHSHAWIHRTTQRIHCLYCHLQHLQECEKHSPVLLLISSSLGNWLCSVHIYTYAYKCIFINSLYLDSQPLLYLQSPQTLAISPRTVALIIGLPISSLGWFFSSFWFIPACQLLQLDWSSHFSWVLSPALDLKSSQNLNPEPKPCLSCLQSHIFPGLTAESNLKFACESHISTPESKVTQKIGEWSFIRLQLLGTGLARELYWAAACLFAINLFFFSLLFI